MNTGDTTGRPCLGCLAQVLRDIAGGVLTFAPTRGVGLSTRVGFLVEPIAFGWRLPGGVSATAAGTPSSPASPPTEVPLRR